MKSILYVGATLMIGASIYGFVDYKKTSRNKEFAKMYDAKEVTEPVKVDKKTTDEVTDQPVVAVEKKNAADEKTVVVAEKPKTPKKKVLSYKLFSRAPLEEKYLKKEFKIEDLKLPAVEPVKKEN